MPLLRKLSTLLPLAVLCVALLGLAKPPPRWVLLGKTEVTDRIDHDTVVVTAKRGDFRKLRLQVERRAVQLHRMTVHFANGNKQEIELRNVIGAGERSRVIDLAGGDRVIKKIHFEYDAQSLGGKATVKVYGRR